MALATQWNTSSATHQVNIEPRETERNTTHIFNYKYKYASACVKRLLRLGNYYTILQLYNQAITVLTGRKKQTQANT